MIFKSSFLLLVLTVSQGFGTSVNMLQLRGLEILEARQSGQCPVCTTVSETLSSCASLGVATGYLQCACTSTVNSQLQSCVNCAHVGDAAVQQLIDSYTKLCTGSTITKPSGAGATGLPTKSSGSSDNGKWAGLAAFGAMIGAALVL